ncbi:Uu.00g139190.m01.CDS01 [Anthostomella pinea]|uniref:Eukaryotic translation initiation factor 2A n=1 Tax=Anthostomella pinea TaxID=933095 RepID=A0AAI8VQR9_9PEZI|nr:Uu.00g139190.m01.CDS01 [Anthostomella pinea]
MANPLQQFAYRTQKAIGVTNTDPVYEPLSGFTKPEGNLRCCVYSPCGRYLAWATSERVCIVDASAGNVLTTFPVTNVYEVAFSPRGSFVSTYERPAKDEAGDATKNLKVWQSVEDIPEGAEKEPLGRFVQKSYTGWNLQYTSDEKFCARMVTNEVQFYDSNDLRTVWNKLRVEGITDFAIAHGQSHNVAVFVPERKGQPAAVKIFNVPQFTTPISQKTFFKGDKVQLKWNSLGTSLIVLAQTDVDKSNKSYYGETNLYLLSANGSLDARVALDKEGPIHDVSWSPNGKEFAVIYGYMPAKTTIFNHRAVAAHSFALSPRNTLIFSPTGRFLLVAGFGNLAGQVDVYDLEKDYQNICTIQSGNPSVCQWSPDSRFLMTATTSPRLRVDNGVKLWHVGGSVMYNEDMVELYNVSWRPALPENLPHADPLSPVPTPHSSAVAYLGTVKTPSKPVGAYRPPGARGMVTPLHFRREDEGGAAHVMSNGAPNVGPNGFGRARRQVPGAELLESGTRPVPGAAPAQVQGVDGDENLSKAALKNKKKRNNKKAKEGESKDANGSLTPPVQGQGPYSGNEGRSPERRGQQQNQRRNDRSRSRHNFPGGNNPGRNRANTGQNGQVAAPAPQIQTSQPPAADALLSPGSQNPASKKLRGLQKKIRAIEDLEMRLAGGEKLEDTQMKKIATKSSIVKELDTLEKEPQ